MLDIPGNVLAHASRSALIAYAGTILLQESGGLYSEDIHRISGFISTLLKTIAVLERHPEIHVKSEPGR